jgi:GLPGLI family protein
LQQQKNNLIIMKKIVAVASMVAIGLAVTAFVAPKVSTSDTFEGVVTYSVSVDNPQVASTMQGSSIKVYLKGEKTKTMSDMGMSKTIVFTNRKTPDDPIILLEVMGNKYQLKNDKDKAKKDDNKPTIKYTDETKTVAGYNCHKAEVSITGKDGQTYTTNVYYTEDLPVYEGGQGQFKGLKGFPLEYSMKQQGMTVSMSATKVDKETLSDDTFTVPSGYKLMTSEEMQADIQKNMSGGN